jgi:hypothetical protein
VAFVYGILPTPVEGKNRIRVPDAAPNLKMKIFKKAKDGGPNSPVDAYFLIEWKKVFSIAFLKFNEGGREAFHTHAFNALTWFLKGSLEEEDISGEKYIYKRSFIPKVTSKEKNHRVKAFVDSWCFTIRGPWDKTWQETENGKETQLTWGRKEI